MPLTGRRMKGRIHVHELDRCLIFRQSGGKAAEGYIHSFENDVLKLYPQGPAEPLQPGNLIFAFVYSNVMGECKYAGEVRRITDYCIEFGGMKLVGSSQKRQNTRVNKRLEYRLTKYYADGVERSFSPPLEIIILNLSATGLYFHCDHKFEVGFTFPLVLRETGRPVLLRVEVVRREIYDRTYNYGCRFVNIAERDVDEIFRFVFREQIAQRRRSKLI